MNQRGLHESTFHQELHRHPSHCTNASSEIGRGRARRTAQRNIKGLDWLAPISFMRPDEEKKALFTGSTLTLAGTNISTATRATLARRGLGAAPVSPCGAGGAGAGAGGEDMDRVSSGAESAESVRERRHGSRGVQIPEQRAIPAWTGAGPKGAVLIATSRADTGTDATGDAQGRIDFKGFRARVEGAKEATGEEQERRNAAPAADAAAVEARTPPAMERNLFLSALANGRIEVMEMHLRRTSP